MNRFLAGVVLTCGLWLPGMAGTMIKGSNGIQVDFIAVFDATPQGLVALIKPDGMAMTVPWDKIDLEALKTQNPDIFGAYQKALVSQVAQPLGLGLAESFISFSQFKEALRQTLRDPSNYNAYRYSYRTTTVGSDGSRQSTVSTTVYHDNGYYSENAPVIVLKRFRDAKGDKARKEIVEKMSQSGGWYGYYNIGRMLEKIDVTLEKLPPERMIKRQGQDITLIRETMKFRDKVREWAESGAITNEQDQRLVGDYLKLIGL